MMKINVHSDMFKKQMRIKQIALKRAEGKSTKELAQLMTVEALRRAAYKSGEIRQGIKYFKIKNGHRVMSSVAGSFPHHLFQNRTVPYTVLRFTKGNRFYAGNQVVSYGGPAKSPSGKPIKWTGVARYFDIARDIAAKKAEDVTVSKVRIALKQ